jgi:hypothetical protein
MQEYILTDDDIDTLEEQGITAQVRNLLSNQLNVPCLLNLTKEPKHHDYAMKQLGEISKDCEQSTAKLIASVAYYEKLSFRGKLRIQLKRKWAHGSVRSSHNKLWRFVWKLIDRIR